MDRNEAMAAAQAKANEANDTPTPVDATGTPHDGSAFSVRVEGVTTSMGQAHITFILSGGEPYTVPFSLAMNAERLLDALREYVEVDRSMGGSTSKAQAHNARLQRGRDIIAQAEWNAYDCEWCGDRGDDADPVTRWLVSPPVDGRGPDFRYCHASCASKAADASVR